MNFSDALLHWYDVHKRELPWRGTRDPYRIWLSEIMLQQTRAETVERYYQRFLDHFPTVGDLAGAPEDEVLKLWEGLGYYSRARNLHAAAKAVAQDLDGHFPESAEGLRKLPGVGPYAANAIASIAYEECVPALDGNQARVLSRVTAWETPPRTPFDLLEPAMARISSARPGDYNQALMDLGTAICTPKKPDCVACPVAEFCLARESGDPESYPRKQPPVAKREIDLTIVLLTDGRRLYIRRRPPRGLLGGLYEFGTVEGHHESAKLEEILSEQGFRDVRLLKALPDSRHVFTHLIWRMKGAVASVSGAPSGFFLAENLDAFAFPSALRVYREIAGEYLDERH